MKRIDCHHHRISLLAILFLLTTILAAIPVFADDANQGAAPANPAPAAPAAPAPVNPAPAPPIVAPMNPVNPIVPPGKEQPPAPAPPPGGLAPTPVLPAPPPLNVAPLQPNPQTPPTIVGRIAQIDVTGNVYISTNAIRSLLRQKVGDNYSPDAAENDREAIYGMGYFTVVSLQATPGANSGDVVVAYTVVENPQVKQIVFSGNTAFSSAKLLSVIETRPGEVLNTNKLDHDIQSIIALYRDKGYRASISEDINIDPKTGILSIPIIEARITAITITGNRKTKLHVITREMKSRPGSLYNQTVFSADLKRIYNTGLFDTVGPADIETPDVGSVALTVPVTEKRTGTVSVGVGFSSREQLVGRAELSESNFRGLGETLSLSWEVGGTQSQSSLEASFGDPWIDKYHTGFNVDLYNKVIYRFYNSFLPNSYTGTGTNSQYLERHIGGLVTFSRPASDVSTTYLTIRSESVSADDVAVALADNFVHQNANISGIGMRYAVNTRDNNFNPAAGGYYSVSLEGVTSRASTVGNAPTPLSPGDHNFAKFGLDLRRYISLQGRRKSLTQNMRVLAMRFLGGYEPAQTPFSEQYFLGGADSLRGYNEDRFWGNKLVLVNVELRIPIGNSLTGVLFTDAGDAWGSIYQGSDLEQHIGFVYNQAIGVGIRVQTPIGPIRVDYGLSRNQGGLADFDIGQSF